MWTYEQKTGRLSLIGQSLAMGYSGCGAGKNNTAMERVRREGPIPRGCWEIRGPPTDHPHMGPFILALLPRDGTETFGRSEFYIHGDSLRHPGEASLGCIILPRWVREAVWNSGDRDLEVV